MRGKFKGSNINFGDVSNMDCTKTSDINVPIKKAFTSKSFIFGLACIAIGVGSIALGGYINGAEEYLKAEDKALTDIDCM